MSVLFFNGTRVHVQPGTLLTFLPPTPQHGTEEYWQFWVENTSHNRVGFRTLAAVIQNIPSSFFTLRATFHPHDKSLEEEEATSNSRDRSFDIKDKDNALEFYPLIFDFMCRRWVDKYAQPHTNHLTFDQLRAFRVKCHPLLPEDIPLDQSRMPDNPPSHHTSRSDRLASKELIGKEHKKLFLQNLVECIDRNDSNTFRDCLLTREKNKLSIGQIKGDDGRLLERNLFQRICNWKVTDERLEMLSILFDPQKGFGGRFYLDNSDEHRTVFTELVQCDHDARRLQRSPSLPVKKSQGQWMDDLQKITHQLVTKAGFPIQTTNIRFYLNKVYRPYNSLLDLSMNRNDMNWASFLAFAPYFSSSELSVRIMTASLMIGYEEINEPSFPSIVSKLLPYISDHPDTIAALQRSVTKAQKDAEADARFEEINNMLENAKKAAQGARVATAAIGGSPSSSSNSKKQRVKE